MLDLFKDLDLQHSSNLLCNLKQVAQPLSLSLPTCEMRHVGRINGDNGRKSTLNSAIRQGWDNNAGDYMLCNVSGTQFLPLLKKKRRRKNCNINGSCGPFQLKHLRIPRRHTDKVSYKTDTNCMRNTSITSWKSARSPPRMSFRKITLHHCHQQSEGSETAGMGGDLCTPSITPPSGT